MSISKIVITGGPCGGKSTAMSRIQEAFSQMGYMVLFVPETATELITGGVAPWSCGTNLDFQKCLIGLQLEKEKIFEKAASKMDSDKVIIVCDRGALDNKAYMTDAEFAGVLDELGTGEVELRDGYDAVFHLVTAAKGAEEFYTTANNQARTETVEQARAIDDRLITAWTGHPHLRVVDNSTDFEGKIRRLVAEISAFLGEPTDMNLRKYKSNFQTIKRKISDVKRVEIENRLSKDEYLELLMNADTTKRQIRKNRYCLTYDGQYFEIDVYPFWDDRAILEIELRSEDTPINLPPHIKVIREVTEDESYKNSSLAKMIAG